MHVIPVLGLWEAGGSLKLSGACRLATRCAGEKAAPLPPEAGLGRILQPVAFMKSGTTTKSAQHKDHKVTKNIREREMRGLFIYLFL